MKTLLTGLMLCLSIPFAAAQFLPFSAPDYSAIKKAIADNSSGYYYPKQLKRVAAYDTTLNNEEMKYLYYGYTFQKEFSPYWKSSVEEQLLKYYRSKSIDPKEYDTIIKLANTSINEFPFDIRTMNFLAYIYHLKGDDAMAKKVHSRFDKIVSCILSTGDGKTSDTAFHVISVGHEYVLLNLFQFEVTSQALVGNCDYMSVKDDGRKVKGIYFNVKTILDKEKELFK